VLLSLLVLEPDHLMSFLPEIDLNVTGTALDATVTAGIT